MQVIATISMLVLIVCNFFITHTATLILVEHLTVLLGVYLLFKITPYQYIFVKTLLFMLILNVFFDIVIYYCVIYLLPNQYIAYIAYCAHYVLHIMILLYSVNLFFHFKTLPRSAIYKDNESYLIRRRPKDFKGFLLSLFTIPWGYYSIVHNGQQYIYKKQGLVARKFIMHKDYHLTRLDYVNIDKLNSLLGTKCTIKNNCYSLFKKVCL